MMISKIFTIYINFLIFNSFMCKLAQCNYLEDNYPKTVIDDAALDVAQLIRKYQYPVETHYVTTEDQYILRLHRIPNPNAPPVLLMHGVEDSSSVWILMGVDQAPGYYLFDNGFDVWMGNARGNRYSRNHTKLNPDTDAIFWNFSFHEMGIFDLPATIDYILQQTGYEKLAYIGHSQGTAAFWTLCSLYPKYNDKISIMHAMAPIAFIKHRKSPIFKDVGQNFLALLKNRFVELLPHKSNFYKMCFTSEITKEMCVGIFNRVVGPDNEINATMYPALFGHFPAGSSHKQFDHFSQHLESNRFCQYDYGEKENIKRYGNSVAPDYPLENITAPVFLHYTLDDHIVSVIDVKRLAKKLPNLVGNYLYPYQNWNHMALLLGTNARKQIHKRMIEIMKEYSLM